MTSQAVARQSTSAVLPRRHKLDEIQVLRGVAALAVVFHHYALAVQEYGPSRSWIVSSNLGALGACGVDVFFVISGFIMVYVTSLDAGADAAREFLRRRVQRVLPLYWVWTTVVLMLWLSGLALKSHHFGWPYIVASYLLIPVFNGASSHPLLDPGWTLSFEMFFYVLFAVSIWLGGVRHRIVVLLAGFVITMLAALLTLPAGSALRGMLTNPLILEFLYGVCVAHLVGRLDLGRRRVQVGRVLLVAGACALLAAAWINAPAPLRAFVWGIPSALVVAGAALLTGKDRPRSLILLGDASYSLYLSHSLIVNAFAMVFKHSHRLQGIAGDFWIVAGTLLTVPTGIIAYLWVEKPLTALIKQGLVRNGESASSANA